MEGNQINNFPKKSESEYPKTIVNSKGEFLINPIYIANSFNNFFCSVAPNILSTIQTFSSLYLHHYSSNFYIIIFHTFKLFQQYSFKNFKISERTNC